MARQAAGRRMNPSASWGCRRKRGQGDEGAPALPLQYDPPARPRAATRLTEATGAAIMGGVLSIRMNDEAVRLLGVLVLRTR